jgi:hypothetical protein
MRPKFDRLLPALERRIHEFLEERLPPARKERTLWKEPVALHWMGIAHTVGWQAGVTASLSFGALKHPDEFVRRNLSRDSFDHHGRQELFQIEDERTDLLCEAEQLDRAGHPLILAALAVIGRRIERTPALTPMTRADSFFVTVADDGESPTWEADARQLAPLSRLQGAARREWLGGSRYEKLLQAMAAFPRRHQARNVMDAVRALDANGKGTKGGEKAAPATVPKLDECLQSIAERDYSGAVQKLSRLLQAEPGTVQALGFRAAAKELLGDKPGALCDIDAALAATRDAAERARLLRMRRRYAPA